MLLTWVFSKFVETDFKKGRNYMITHNGTDHQIDMLAIPSEWVQWKRYLHRELKTNTDLDNGKKRDTLKRRCMCMDGIQGLGM